MGDNLVYLLTLDANRKERNLLAKVLLCYPKLKEVQILDKGVPSGRFQPGMLSMAWGKLLAKLEYAEFSRLVLQDDFPISVWRKQRELDNKSMEIELGHLTNISRCKLKMLAGVAIKAYAAWGGDSRGYFESHEQFYLESQYL